MGEALDVLDERIAVLVAAGQAAQDEHRRIRKPSQTAQLHGRSSYRRTHHEVSWHVVVGSGKGPAPRWGYACLVSQKIFEISSILSSSSCATAGSVEPFAPWPPASLV